MRKEMLRVHASWNNNSRDFFRLVLVNFPLTMESVANRVISDDTIVHVTLLRQKW